jgi:hypothetical protein
MRRLLLLALLLMLPACTGQPAAFSPDSSPVPGTPAPPARLDLNRLGALRDSLAAALRAHSTQGNVDLAWGPGVAAHPAGPYADAAPEADAAGLQAGGAGEAPAAATVTDAFKQLDGPRGGAYLLLVDAAHPPGAGPLPGAVSPGDQPSCATPAPGAANPTCLRKQVSDGLLAAWFARDTRMFFKVGETTTVYRPVEALATGAALAVAGFQLRDESKIQAGEDILDHELKTAVDDHYGMLFGLVSVTAAGGHSVTDYNTHLADQAGAAEVLMEAFDWSREQRFQAAAQKLLQPLLDERFSARALSGGYIAGFDLQSSGPTDNPPADVLATVLTLQAAHHYDRDDGGHFNRLEEAAAAGLLAVVDADRKAGGDPGAGLPAALPSSGPAQRSGLTTALAVTTLRDLG